MEKNINSMDEKTIADAAYDSCGGDLEDIDVVIGKDGDVHAPKLEQELPPLDDILINLGFWIDTAVRAGRVLITQKYAMSKPEQDKES